MQPEMLILVNEQDEQIGEMEKMEAHRKGLLHRAFSVFLFNAKGEVMMQQRSLEKYHSPGLWSNTCCSHPHVGESLQEAVHRRLMEEMGLQADTQHVYSFIYKADFDNGLCEHEFDHVFVGFCDELPQINPSEVAAWKFISIDDLQKDLHEKASEYSVWLKICFSDVMVKIQLSTPFINLQVNSL